MTRGGGQTRAMLLVGIDDDEVFPHCLWAGPLPAAGLLGLVVGFVAHNDGGQFFVLVIKLAVVVDLAVIVINVVIVLAAVVVVVLCNLERCRDKVVR